MAESDTAELATDEHGYLDSLTERVLAAVFEVSNTLGLCLLVDFQKSKVEWKRIIQGFHVPERIAEPTVPG